eukprot:scaffold91_cov85-Isochrysis_galbana.AAC.2
MGEADLDPASGVGGSAGGASAGLPPNSFGRCGKPRGSFKCPNLEVISRWIDWPVWPRADWRLIPEGVRAAVRACSAHRRRDSSLSHAYVRACGGRVGKGRGRGRTWLPSA